MSSEINKNNEEVEENQNQGEQYRPSEEDQDQEQNADNNMDEEVQEQPQNRRQVDQEQKNMEEEHKQNEQEDQMEEECAEQENQGADEQQQGNSQQLEAQQQQQGIQKQNKNMDSKINQQQQQQIQSKEGEKKQAEQIQEIKNPEKQMENKQNEKQQNIQMENPENQLKLDEKVSKNIIGVIAKKNLESYANKIEKKLVQKEKAQFNLISEMMLKTREINNLKQKLSTSTSNLEQQSTKLNQSEQQMKILSAKLTKSESKIESLQNQLTKYHELGDISALLNKVEELEILVKTQQKEIQFLNSQKENQKNQQQKQNQKLTKDQLEKMQNLTNENGQLKAQVKCLQKQKIDCQKIISENNEIISKLDSQLKDKMSDLEEQKRNIKQLQDTYNAAKKKLDELSNQENKAEKKQHQTEKQMKLQKQAYFRQYKQLEAEYIGMQQSNTDLKNRIHSMRMQIKMTMKSKVNKKDYDQIVHKYRKAKQCLQRVIAENKQLKYCEQNKDNDSGQNGAQIPNKKNINILEHYEEHDNLHQYMKIFNTHLHKSIDYLKETNQITENITIQQYKNEIAEKQNLIVSLNNKILRLERMIQIMQKQLIFKNNLAQQMSSENKQLRQQKNELSKKKNNLQWELLDCSETQTSIRKLEISSLGLITKNRKLIADRNTWRQLYQNLKAQYEKFVNREPKSSNQEQSQVDKDGEMADQNQQNAGKSLDKIMGKKSEEKKQLITSQTQTEGMNQYYYRELKDVLSILKKFPEKTKKLWEGLESKKNELEQLKQKYQGIKQTYNVKFKDLQLEKHKNETWRAQCREEVVGEFQQLREFVENQRLIGSLRKAKNLIEALEKQEGEADDQ